MPCVEKLPKATVIPIQCHMLMCSVRHINVNEKALLSLRLADLTTPLRSEHKTRSPQVIRSNCMEKIAYTKHIKAIRLNNAFDVFIQSRQKYALWSKNNEKT